MPRQVAASVENNFSKGLITEATGLNFPENAVTDTYNCVFSRQGGVSRRLGLDLEDNFQWGPARTKRAVSKYFWKSTGADSTANIVVIQTGDILDFYVNTDSSEASPLSVQQLTLPLGTVWLSDYASTSVLEPAHYECQYADGNGYLFVCNPAMLPIYITYASGEVGSNPIEVKIRDLVGIDEGTSVPDDLRPETLTASHRYNLANQGWNKGYRAESTNSVLIGTGTQTFFLDQAGYPIAEGDRVKIYEISSANRDLIGANYMIGNVTGYSGLSLEVNVLTVGGAGTFASWGIVAEPAPIAEWYSDIRNYPSNSDVWWYFKDSTDVFDPAGTINNIPQSSGPAPKGVFILEAFNQQRSTAIRDSTLAAVTTEGARPSTTAWFQGRAWYSGVKYQDFNENIYFSQIIEKPGQFGYCYQKNDPTSEERSDLLPSDGGVITIQGAGQIHKLFPFKNGLLVFATNGIWFISGSQGLGFVANDYSITKISNVETLSGSSFVNVQGAPVWWNHEGIHTLAVQDNGMQVASLSDDKIASFYEEIPERSKLYATGSYNPSTFQILWTYRSEVETGIPDRYDFDRVLIFDTRLQAFYPWDISTSSTYPHVNGVIVVSGITDYDDISPITKFIVSTTSWDSRFSFAEERDTDYVDWASHDTGLDYDAYFITGYKLKGGGMRKFQTNYINIFTDNTDEGSFTFQTRWDYAIAGSTGRWSTAQYVNMDSSEVYSTRVRRLKLRGHGLACQYKVTSVDGEPFDISGWATQDSVNSRP